MLAARLMLEQGVEVEALNFFTGFCVEGHTHAIRRRDADRPRRNGALQVAEQLGIRLHFIDVVEEYKSVVLAPRHGYGTHLNPCIDCKSFMVGRALEWMRSRGLDFVVTGEVLGQRPKSQRRETMPIVACESGAHDLLLRPLSAKLLEPTLPEREGWVERERLHAFNGRSRRPQIALARAFGIEEWSQPAGGCCFLTDRYYSARLRDLWRARGRRDYELDDVMLLKVGRHLRPRAHFKLIVAREEGENRYLEGYRKRFVHLRACSHPGPLALVDGVLRGDDDVRLAARIVARFGQGRDAGRVAVEVISPGGRHESREVVPLAAQELPREWYV